MLGSRIWRLCLAVAVVLSTAYAGLLYYVYVHDAGWPVVAFNQDYRDSRSVRIDPLGQDLYMLSGAGSNITILIGADEVLMVDSSTAWFVDRIDAAIRSLTDKPVTLIINTHAHGDHQEGNALFVSRGARVIAHRSARALLLKDKFALPETQYAPKITTFDDEMRLTFAGQSIRLVHVPNAHTNGDVVVHFETGGVMATGDLFVHQGLPFIDESLGGNIDGFLSAMSKLIAQSENIRHVVPGHGPLATRENLRDSFSRLARIRETVALGQHMGLTQRTIPLIYPTWSWPLKWNVEGMSHEYFARVTYRTLNQHLRDERESDG